MFSEVSLQRDAGLRTTGGELVEPTAESGDVGVQGLWRSLEDAGSKILWKSCSMKSTEGDIITFRH